MRINLKDWCIENGKSHLLSEWNAEKNAPATPSQYTPQSNKKAWWTCAHGHSWEAAICNRTRGTRCLIVQERNRFLVIMI